MIFDFGKKRSRHNDADDAIFREFLCYEAASGQKKFGTVVEGGVCRASVCCKFKVDAKGGGEVTNGGWLEITGGGKRSGFQDNPDISSEIKTMSAGIKCYTAWKSSSGNPYSTMRLGMKENKNINATPTANEILREVILNDKLVRAVNKDSIAEGQINEFEFFYKAVNSLASKTKNIAKSVGGWLKNIWKTFLGKIKVALDKIKKLGTNNIS